jgi:hypothetical protein
MTDVGCFVCANLKSRLLDAVCFKNNYAIPIGGESFLLQFKAGSGKREVGSTKF